MSETEQVVSIGDPMPRVASAAYHGAYEIVVGWAAGAPREHSADLVDLAPLILTHKLYKPLRDNPDLLKTVHIIENGSAIAWGADDAIDMAATSIERLAEERMSSENFRAWLEQHKFSYDAAAAQLGISRRQVAYYADQRPVPRYIALACRYLDLELEPKASRDKAGPYHEARIARFMEQMRSLWAEMETSLEPEATSPSIQESLARPEFPNSDAPGVRLHPEASKRKR